MPERPIPRAIEGRQLKPRARLFQERHLFGHGNASKIFISVWVAAKAVNDCFVLQLAIIVFGKCKLFIECFCHRMYLPRLAVHVGYESRLHDIAEAPVNPVIKTLV